MNPALDNDRGSTPKAVQASSNVAYTGNFSLTTSLPVRSRPLANFLDIEKRNLAELQGARELSYRVLSETVNG